MYRSVKEFVDDWTRESGISLKVERVLTDASLSQKTDPEGRTLGQLAWHMVIMTGMTGSAVGLEVDAPPRTTEPPSSAASIADAYERAARSLGEQAAKMLKDEQLGAEISLFGRNLTRAAALHSLVRHQIHHRGQMTVLIRQAGLAVPGVYGPSREESAAMRAKQSGAK
jgi:uncharacterized damage-inducible protein DinB